MCMIKNYIKNKLVKVKTEIILILELNKCILQMFITYLLNISCNTHVT